jgi:hypothetical protein
MKRFIELDILRGFLLLLMVVNHSPSSLRVFTDQPVGFFSTAEGFVFVSAFLAGILFQRRSEKLGFGAASAAAFSRAFRIYRAHLITLFFAFVVGGILLAELPGMQNLLNEYFKNPLAAASASLALVFQPPLLDILPMYVLLSLLTPCAFWAGERWGWKRVFFVSIGIWVISQFRVRDMFIAATKDLSFLSLGPFDLLSWQLLWIGGVFFGKSLQERKPLFRLSFRAELFLIIVAIGFLGLRWYTIAMQIDPSKEFWFLDKWHLGPLRLLNFVAVTWIAAKFLPQLQRLQVALHPLAAVGRNMLPIFSCQICLSLVFAAAIDPSKGHRSIVSLLVAAQLVSVFVIAWLFEWHGTRLQTSGSEARPAGIGL